MVGGGVAGLTCAWRLRRAGLTEDVLVVDLGREPGGNARAGRNDVSPFPWGAHYLRAPTAEHPALERFLEEVGLIRGRDRQGRLDWDTRAVGVAPLERVFEGGVWGEGLFPPLSGDAAAREALAAFAARIESLAARRDAAGRRAFAIPVAASAADADLRALDQVSFASWLEAEGLDHPALRWYLDYACRDDYGCRLETTSAWAGLHYFAARHTEDPSRDVILTWPEGNARLVALLAAASGGVRFEGRRLCFALEPGRAPGDPSAALVYDVEGDRVERLEARQLVWAGPRFLLGRLLPEPPPGLEAFTYAPWLVANLTLDAPPAGVGAGLAWDNVPFDGDGLGYVVANRDVRPDEPCVVTWYEPFTDPDPRAAREALLALDHAAIVARLSEHLLALHPDLRGRIRSVDAWRWGHPMIRPVPGFLWGPERAAAAEPLGALLCAHSDLSGISIFEEAFWQGVVAGEEVLRRMERAFESIL